MRTGIYPGTFDPITFGHMDIVRRALSVVDKLVIGVALDSAKQPLFDVKTRAAMVEKDISNALGVDAERVAVKPFRVVRSTRPLSGLSRLRMISSCVLPAFAGTIFTIRPALPSALTSVIASASFCTFHPGGAVSAKPIGSW